jgi:hypothetical protein
MLVELTDCQWCALWSIDASWSCLHLLLAVLLDQSQIAVGCGDMKIYDGIISLTPCNASSK